VGILIVSYLDEIINYTASEMVSMDSLELDKIFNICLNLTKYIILLIKMIKYRMLYEGIHTLYA